MYADRCEECRERFQKENSKRKINTEKGLFNTLEIYKQNKKL